MSSLRPCALLLLIVNVTLSQNHLSIVNVTLPQNHSRFNEIVNATITLLSKCPSRNVGQTVLLGGEYNDFFGKGLFNFKAVALIADSKKNAFETFTLTKYSHLMYHNVSHLLMKLHHFVLVASSQPLMRSVLQRTKDSPWANADGFYILVDRKTEERGCINAHAYLWTAWKYDLLSVIFLCIDPNDGIVCYTYNPYSSEMPSDWQEVERLKGRHGHPWIIFKKKCVFDPTTCSDLTFDKTTNLNGYEVRLNAIEIAPFVNIDWTKKGLDRFSGENSDLMKVVFHKLGASINIIVFGNDHELGGIGPNGTLTGLLEAVSDGRMDMGLNARPLFAMWKLKYTYPHIRSGVCLMIERPQELSEFAKLMKFLSPSVVGAIIVINFVAYAVLQMYQGRNRASLETLRLACCMAIMHPPKINSTRIIICMAFLLYLNVNVWLQSHWLSLLTIPVFHDTINNLKSLKRTGYEIHGPMSLKELFSDPVLRSRYVIVPFHKCANYIENSTNIVCAGDCYNVIYKTNSQEKFCKSPRLINITHTFVAREDWPLFKRVDRIIQYMVQGGLSNKFREDSLTHIRYSRRTKRAMKTGFNAVTLQQMDFSFYILGIGYICAIIAFVAELIIARRAGKRRSREGIGKERKKKTSWIE